LDESAQKGVDLVSVALQRELGMEALLAHITQTEADVSHDVEAGDGGEFDELVQIAVVKLIAVFHVFVFDIKEILHAEKIVHGADDAVVSLHTVDLNGPLRVMVALPELQTKPEGHASGRAFLRLLKLARLHLRDLKIFRAYLHGFRDIEITVVGEADFGYTARESSGGHLRHGVFRIERTGAVDVVICEIH
jgi:hypothetical protein